MEIDELILEMQAVKEKYPTLELQEILRLFNIAATQELTKMIWRASNG